MKDTLRHSAGQLKYLRLLAEKYPTQQATFTGIINLQAILNLPKGTEHFISDLHGEFEAVAHILNNCSGVIREKVQLVFAGKLSPREQSELCTLVYYPVAKMEKLQREGRDSAAWYRATLENLIALNKYLSSKYTREKVRSALPAEYSFIIDELLHAQPDEDDNQLVYHQKIIDTIIDIDSASDFIEALAALTKRLAVDHLHIVGDIFDRGDHADKIIDMLGDYHSLDIQWGNHDVLWMGAAAGNAANIATIIRSNMGYGNLEILENGYGISLRSLTVFAEQQYPELSAHEAAYKAISIMLMKLEGQIILRHPEYEMEDRLLLDKIDYASGTVDIEGKTYPVSDLSLPTVDRENPYELTLGEAQVLGELRRAFQRSERLHRHIRFLYDNGAMYRVFNGNLLYHGCIPLDGDGNFDAVCMGGEVYTGRAYMDYADRMTRQGYYNANDRDALDFLWYLWCGKKSPLSGREFKTFERIFIDDKSAWEEPKNPYYTYYQTEQTCNMILREFGLFSPHAHIINGHTPVKVAKGESPIRAGGKLLVIDGGFSKAYQHTTGIAGYTLIFNSHGMRIKAHRAFESVEKVLAENADIESETDTFETMPRRLMVEDTDAGVDIQERIRDLKALLATTREGILSIGEAE